MPANRLYNISSLDQRLILHLNQVNRIITLAKILSEIENSEIKRLNSYKGGNWILHAIISSTEILLRDIAYSFPFN